MSFSPFKTEYIQWNGEEYHFYNNPFTHLLHQKPELMALMKQDWPSGRPLCEAMWKIEDDQLWMTGFYDLRMVNGMRSTPEYELQQFFGSNEAKLADWYSGEIMLYRGKRWDSFGFLCEYMVKMTVESGRILSYEIEHVQETDPRVIKITQEKSFVHDRVKKIEESVFSKLTTGKQTETGKRFHAWLFEDGDNQVT